MRDVSTLFNFAHCLSSYNEGYLIQSSSIALGWTRKGIPELLTTPSYSLCNMGKMTRRILVFFRREACGVFFKWIKKDVLPNAVLHILTGTAIRQVLMLLTFQFRNCRILVTKWFQTCWILSSVKTFIGSKCQLEVHFILWFTKFRKVRIKIYRKVFSLWPKSEYYFFYEAFEHTLSVYATLLKKIGSLAYDPKFFSFFFCPNTFLLG